MEQEKLIEAAMGVLKFELADSGDVGQKERSLVSDDYKKKVLQTLSKVTRQCCAASSFSCYVNIDCTVCCEIYR